MAKERKTTRPLTAKENKARHRLYMDFVKKNEIASKAPMAKAKAKARLLAWDKAHNQ